LLIWGKKGGKSVTLLDMEDPINPLFAFFINWILEDKQFCAERFLLDSNSPNNNVLKAIVEN
jgi:hypothetical protein